MSGKSDELKRVLAEIEAAALGLDLDITDRVKVNHVWFVQVVVKFDNAMVIVSVGALTVCVEARGYRPAPPEAKLLGDAIRERLAKL